MGKGIESARTAGAGLHADVLDDFKDQLMIVLLKRLKTLGHNLQFSLAEINDTGHDLVSFRVDEKRNFHFTLEKKS